jgi:hypothetical protein
MKLFTPSTKSFLVFLFALVILNGCIDETIEGASSSTTSIAFKANTVTMPYVTLNNCVYSTSPNGTRFNLNIDYQGPQGDPVYKIEYTYKISTSTSITNGTPLFNSSGFTDTNTDDVPSVFRGKTSTKTTFNIKADNFTCWRWGTSTSTIDYVFTLTTNSGKTSTINMTLSKPAGAN